MPNENKFEYGNPSPHVIVPVLHPNGDLHNIAVPEDTDLSELHSALSDAGYEHPALNAALPSNGPTVEGSLEHSQQFRDETRRIYDETNQGRDKSEAAVILKKDASTPTRIDRQWSETAGGGRKMNLDIDPGASSALVHVHPRLGQPILSPRDIQTMRELNVPVYAVSPAGLFSIDKDGKPFQVFSGTDWMNDNPQADAKNNKAIESGNYVVKVQLKGGKEVVLDSGGKDYPLEMLKQLKAKGGEGFTAKDIKNVVALSHDEIKTKKVQ